MKRVILIHGWSGSTNNNWLPWLRSELEKLGHKVLAPEMPETDAPDIEKWLGHLSQTVGVPDEDTYFVGHSIGCQAILRYLETAGSPVGGAIFVAGWFNLDNMEDEEEEKIAKPWLKLPIDLEKIETLLPRSTLIISDNDPYGCFEENKAKFAELDSKIVVLPNAGHITDEKHQEILFETLEILK